MTSPSFQRARRSSQLLQYLVEAVLNGQEDGLKEFTIATEVFGRSSSFDSRVDSLVRVEATRLRTRLERYYATADDQDVLEILLPAGSYIPILRQRNAGDVKPEEPAPVAPAAPIPENSRLSHRSRWISTAIILAFTATVVLATRLRMAERPALRVKATQRVAVPSGVALSPVLSPDGKSLFYASNTGDTRLRIWRQPLRGGTPQAMTTPDWDASELDLSPDGRLLAYRSMRSGGGIHIQPAAGGAELLIAASGHSPRFSADGKQVLFWVEEPHTSFGRVYWAGLSGHDEPMPVARQFADAHHPQWTPDGRVILCGTFYPDIKSKEHDVWVVPLRGDDPPVKTGIVDVLAGKGIALHPRSMNTTTFQWRENTLIFAAVSQGQTALYSIAMKPGSWVPAGEPHLLTDDPNSREGPSVRGNRIAFTSTDANLNIYRIPLDAKGIAAADPVTLTQASGAEYAPSLSLDGRVLVYLAKRSAQMQLWKRDMLTGLETELFRGNIANRLRVSGDGKKAFFPLWEGPPPQRQEIHEADMTTGRIRKVCHDCGAPTSASFSGDFVLYQPGTRLSRLALLNVATAEILEIVRHPHHAVLAGRFSPDGHWIAFVLDRGLDGKQLYVAPFRGAVLVPESDWIPVSELQLSSYEPAWSPDGRAIYFISDRNGSRDVWMQPLHERSKRAEGPARLVYQFRNVKLTPMKYQSVYLHYTGLSVAPGSALLTLSELTSDIWLGTVLP